jgi:2-hydroxychromene-2-carboxylate isomerase
MRIDCMDDGPQLIGMVAATLGKGYVLTFEEMEKLAAYIPEQDVHDPEVVQAALDRFGIQPRKTETVVTHLNTAFG